MKFDISGFFENKVSRKTLKFKNRTIITGALHEDQYTFLILSRSVFSQNEKMFQSKLVQKVNTDILCSTFFFFGKSCRL